MGLKVQTKFEQFIITISQFWTSMIMTIEGHIPLEVLIESVFSYISRSWDIRVDSGSRFAINREPRGIPSFESRPMDHLFKLTIIFC